MQLPVSCANNGKYLLNISQSVNEDGHYCNTVFVNIRVFKDKASIYIYLCSVYVQSLLGYEMIKFFMSFL